MTFDRVDSNQKEIVKQLRDIGCTVQLLNKVKSGCPDILVGVRGLNLLFEIKTEKGTLTEDERIWISKWSGQVRVVKSFDDILETIENLELGDYNV